MNGKLKSSFDFQLAYALGKTEAQLEELARSFTQPEQEFVSRVAELLYSKRSGDSQDLSLSELPTSTSKLDSRMGEVALVSGSRSKTSKESKARKSNKGKSFWSIKRRKEQAKRMKRNQRKLQLARKRAFELMKANSALRRAA